MSGPYTADMDVLRRARQAALGGPPRRLASRWVMPCVALAVFGLITWWFGASYLQLYRLDREAARLEQEKRRLEQSNAALREEIKLLNTPAYIERLAREHLGLIKPGEIAVMLVEKKPAAPGKPPLQRRP